MKGLYVMNQYLVRMEFQGKVVTTSIWASDPDTVIEMLLGDDAHRGEFVKILSVRKVNDSKEK